MPTDLIGGFLIGLMSGFYLALCLQFSVLFSFVVIKHLEKK